MILTLNLQVLVAASRGSWFSSVHLQKQHGLYNLEAEWIHWGLDDCMFAISFYISYKPVNGHCRLQRGRQPLGWSRCHRYGEIQAFGCSPSNWKTLLRWALLALLALTGLVGCNRYKGCTTGGRSRVFCAIYGDQLLSKCLWKCKVQKWSYFKRLFSLRV